VVLYGFGRIGRLLARELMSKTGKGSQLRLRAIVTRDKDATTLEKGLRFCVMTQFTVILVP
jgi:glyceraldehyde 3-phosphate dehydrogenase